MSSAWSCETPRRRILSQGTRLAARDADDAGHGRASDWLRRIQQSTVTLETHPHAFPRVGLYEGEDIHARFIMRHVLYYFVDEPNHVVTIIDVVHSARQTERDDYEER